MSELENSINCYSIPHHNPSTESVNFSNSSITCLTLADHSLYAKVEPIGKCDLQLSLFLSHTQTHTLSLPTVSLARFWCDQYNFFLSLIIVRLHRYKPLGTFIAYAIVHRGPLPQFMSKLTYGQISGQPVVPHIDDIHDLDVRANIKKVWD